MVIEQPIKAGHKPINYLRLSVTDRCNLRCVYCMPEEGIDFLPHSSILTYEEMLHLVRISTRSGIRKVRLTGGEPLVRKGFIGFLEKLCEIEELEEITLTTNGVLLKEYAQALKECGICRLNVSLDTLKPERFSQITGRDYFDRVWEGILLAEKCGFNPLKINVVAIRGVNDEEILDFARLTIEKPLHVRFIELMPVGEKNIWSDEKFISTEEIFGIIKTLGTLRPILSNSLDGPAERYIMDGAKGEIGLIGAMSHHFCDSCNRLRLTAEGHLRSCLFSDQEIDVKTPLREGKGDEYILELLRSAAITKTRDRGPIQSGPRKCVRHMSSIGG
ncbi:MAG: GTP 3',8-cyclase MoaA [Deltaproteobacteria bacterium]|nr:GTP 3',8-cyclase MoaA [Deltaproteobacteria bacterium]